MLREALSQTGSVGAPGAGSRTTSSTSASGPAAIRGSCASSSATAATASRAPPRSCTRGCGRSWRAGSARRRWPTGRRPARAPPGRPRSRGRRARSPPGSRPAACPVAPVGRRARLRAARVRAGARAPGPRVARAGGPRDDLAALHGVADVRPAASRRGSATTTTPEGRSPGGVLGEGVGARGPSRSAGRRSKCAWSPHEREPSARCP